MLPELPVTSALRLRCVCVASALRFGCPSGGPGPPEEPESESEKVNFPAWGDTTILANLTPKRSPKVNSLFAKSE